MNHLRIIAIVAALAAVSPAAAEERDQSMMNAPIVFFDIAGPDAAAQRSFYAGVFGWRVADDGAVSVATTAPLQGTLRTEAIAENLLYFGVPDVAAALDSVVAHGGSVEAPRFAVPGVVILGLFRDPAGNRMGLVEIGTDGKAIVP